MSFNPEETEDDYHRRVCFADTISGAYLAIQFDAKKHEKLYIHVPENLDEIIRKMKIIKPTKEQCWDADFTGEYWVTMPVKMKCIGYINIYYDYYNWNYKVYWKYIERYR